VESYVIASFSSGNSCDTIGDLDQAVLELERTFGVRIIWGLFSREADLCVDMIDVESLTLGFDHPHRNSGIGQVTFVEVKDCFFAELVAIAFSHIHSPLLAARAAVTNTI